MYAAMSCEAMLFFSLGLTQSIGLHFTWTFTWNFTYILQLFKPRCPIAVWRLEHKDIDLNIL